MQLSGSTSNLAKKRSWIGPTALIAVAAVGLILVWCFRDAIAHANTVLLPLIAQAKQTPLRSAVGFFAAYLIVTAASIPIEIVFAVGAGAIFGLVEGTLLASFAAGLGATLSFLASRHFLRDIIRRHFVQQLARIDRGIDEDGSYYLLTLRLLPIFPYSVVNLLMGVTSFPTLRFYILSQLGTLPAIALYVNAGTEFAKLKNLFDILSPSIIISLMLLAFFPLAARAIVKLWRRARGS